MDKEKNKNNTSTNKVEDTVNKMADELDKGFRNAYEEVKKEAKPAYEQAKQKFNDVKNETSEISKDEIENGKGLAAISYIGILVLIPYLTEKNNKFVLFHAKEGLNLFLLSVIAGFASSILVVIPIIGLLLSIIPVAVGIAHLVLAIMGVINAANGEAKELPIINKIKLIK